MISRDRQTSGKAETKDGRPPRNRLLYLLRRSQNLARLGVEDIVRAEGLTARDYTALWFLKTIEPCSTADLARAEHISPQAAVQQVAQLRSKGLVTSTASDRNRRISSISLTEEGNRRFEMIDQAARALEEALMADLTPLERGILMPLLRKLIASAEKLGSPREEI